MRRFLSVLGLWLSLRLNGIWNLCLTIISCTHLSDFTPLILSPGFSFCFIWHYMLFRLWEDSRVFMARGQPQTQQKFPNLRLTIILKFYFLIPPIITTGFLVYYLFQYCFGVHLKRTPRVFLGIWLYPQTQQYKLLLVLIFTVMEWILHQRCCRPTFINQFPTLTTHVSQNLSLNLYLTTQPPQDNGHTLGSLWYHVLRKRCNVKMGWKKNTTTNKS